MPHIPATEFKARCLDLMDRVAERRATYVITKRGRPVAKLVPADRPRKKEIFGCMADRTEFVGDLEKGPWTEAEWREFQREHAEQTSVWEREWREHGRISARSIQGRAPSRSHRRAPRKRGRAG